MPRTDAALVLDDFAALFDRHAGPVRSCLSRRIGASVADDLLGQTFLVAFERRGSYDRARPDARNLPARAELSALRHALACLSADNSRGWGRTTRFGSLGRIMARVLLLRSRGEGR